MKVPAVCDLLSPETDLGEVWYGQPFSEEYWAEVRSVFERLEKEEALGMSREDPGEMGQDVSVPLLLAFRNEIVRVYEDDRGLPRKIVERFLERFRDFQNEARQIEKDAGTKEDGLTVIERSSEVGNWNRFRLGTARESELLPSDAELPTRIVHLDFADDGSTELEMILNNGWQLGFCVRNEGASAGSALLFDVELVGAPYPIMVIEF